jgi:hypothetical protein
MSRLRTRFRSVACMPSRLRTVGVTLAVFESESRFAQHIQSIRPTSPDIEGTRSHTHEMERGVIDVVGVCVASEPSVSL